MLMKTFTRQPNRWLAGLLMLMLASSPLYSQVYTHRLPASTGTANLNQFGAFGSDVTVPKSTLQGVNTTPLLAEDVQRDRLGLPARLGVDVAANVDVIPAATKAAKSGYLVSSYQFDIPDALGLSVVFNNLQLAEGARLFIYNADRTILFGPITAQQNGVNFWSDLIEGSSAIIEVQEPDQVVGQSRVFVSKLVQYYRFAPRFGFGTSQACEINTICYPSYQNEADGVNLLLTNYSPYTYACTGAIVNSTQQDFRSYLLTAFHCYDFNEDGVQQSGELAAAANTQFRFHWESPTCATAADNVYLTLTGANFRSAYANSDFTLLELTQQVPPSENITYLGWDRGGALPSSPFGIHHPSADIKKISFSPSATTLVNVTPGPNYVVNAGTTHLQVTWAGSPNNLGVTEGGSSGSPLFDANRRIVGQLHGGGSFCNSPTSPDQYGRFFTSWTGGATAATRLSNWLDPASAGSNTTNSVKSTVVGPATLATSGSFSINSGSSAVTSWTITGGAGIVSPTTGTGNQANLTALTNGSNLTITFGISAGQSYAIQFAKTFNVSVPANTPPTVANPVSPQSATVGVAYTLSLASVFTDAETPSQLTLSVSGLPMGLSFSPPSTISGTPSMSGVSMVTVKASDPGSLTASNSFNITVSPAATPPPGNSPPTVANPVPPQSATVGVAYTLSLANVFTDAETPNQLTLSVAGLPAGLMFTAPATISGTPSMSGVSTVTVKATDPGSLTASNSFNITVSPAATPPPGNSPPTVANPVPPQSATVGVAYTLSLANVFTDAETPNQLTLSVAGLPAGLMFTAPATISGTPSMSGVSTVMVTATDPGSLTGSTSFMLTVSPAAGTPPPTGGSFAIVGVTGVSCATVSVGQRTLSFTPQYSGLNGMPVSFSVANEMLPTTAPGPYTLNLYTDNPVITLKAVQSGTAGEASFAYNWLVACNGGTPPPPPPTTGTFSITGVTTVSCTTLSVGARMLSFTPQYSGLNGMPVSFSVANEMLPTTAPGPYSLRVYTDNPVITLKAVQSGTEASFAYNWLNACSGGSPGSIRVGAVGELTTTVRATLLPNPVGSEFRVRIEGAQGQTVGLLLSDLSGHSVLNRWVAVSTDDHQETLRFSQPGLGLYLLRVSAGQQVVTLKVIRE